MCRKAQPCRAVGGVRSNIIKRSCCFSLLEKEADPLEPEGRRLWVSDRSHPTGRGRSEEEEREREGKGGGKEGEGVQEQPVESVREPADPQ